MIPPQNCQFIYSFQMYPLLFINFFLQAVPLIPQFIPLFILSPVSIDLIQIILLIVLLLPHLIFSLKGQYFLGPYSIVFQSLLVEPLNFSVTPDK